MSDLLKKLMSFGPSGSDCPGWEDAEARDEDEIEFDMPLAGLVAPLFGCT